MRQVVVFQFHGADVIGIGHFILILIFFHYGIAPNIVQIGPGFLVLGMSLSNQGFSPVPGFRFHGLRQNVLFRKQHFQVGLHFRSGKDTFMEGGENRDQHIGIVFDGVQIVMVFIVGMSAFVGVQIGFQFCFHSTVGCFCGHDIRILRKIRGTENAADTGTGHHGTGGHTAQQHNDDSSQNQHHEHTLTVIPYIENSLFNCFLRPGSSGSCGSCRRLRCFLSLTSLLDILPLDMFFLQITGYRVGSCKAGIVLNRFLIQNLRIGFICCLLRFGYIPPGLGLMVMECLPHPASGMKHTLFRQFLGLVSCLHPHIFLLHFVNLVVGGKGDLLGRTAQRIVPQLPVGLFLHVLKTNRGFARAGGFVEYPFLRLYGFGRDLRLGCIQLIRRPVRPFNVLAKGRISAFLVGKLQPGGRTLPGLASFLDSSRILFGSLSLPVPSMGMGSFFDRRFRKRYRFCLGIEMGFFLTGADAFHLAGGKVFGDRTVMGHFLCNLFRRFHFLHASPPVFP